MNPFENSQSASDVEQRLHELLPLRSSNPGDVKTVLNSIGLDCSQLIQRNNVPDYHVAHHITQEYDGFIQCRANAPSAKWLRFLVTNRFKWHIRFHFRDARLVEIIVTREETGPL